MCVCVCRKLFTIFEQSVDLVSSIDIHNIDSRLAVVELCNEIAAVGSGRSLLNKKKPGTNNACEAEKGC